jgi:hypothetical protein
MTNPKRPKKKRVAETYEDLVRARIAAQFRADPLLSPPRTSFDERSRDFLREQAYRFEKTHPAEWSSILKLLNRFSIESRSIDEVRIKLGEIVYGYKWLDERPNDRIKSLAATAERIAEQLETLRVGLVEIAGKEPSSFTLCFSTFSKLTGFPIDDFDMSTFQFWLAIYAKAVNITALSLSVSTGIETGAGRPGRPRLPYTLVTNALIDLWVHTTGEQVPVARGHAKSSSDKTEPTQPAVAFVFFGLKMIDSKVTASTAITEINKARKVKASPLNLPDMTLASSSGDASMRDPFVEHVRALLNRSAELNKADS